MQNNKQGSIRVSFIVSILVAAAGLLCFSASASAQTIIISDLQTTAPTSSDPGFSITAPSLVSTPSRTFTADGGALGTGTFTLSADATMTPGNDIDVTFTAPNAEGLRVQQDDFPIDSTWYFTEVTLTLEPTGPFQGIAFVQLGRLGGTANTNIIEAVSVTQTGVSAYVGPSTDPTQTQLTEINESSWSGTTPPVSLQNPTSGDPAASSVYLFLDDNNIQSFTFRLWVQRNAFVTEPQNNQNQVIASIGLHAVPEPSSAVLVGLGVFLVLARQRGRLRRASV